MVLLDSEGIDATNSENTDDHQIFTLTVLLASVLIYNSQGVPTRSDVEKLEYPWQLSSRTDIRTTVSGIVCIKKAGKLIPVVVESSVTRQNILLCVQTKDRKTVVHNIFFFFFTFYTLDSDK